MVLLKKLITELENKIPDISNLATRTALTAVENKIPSISSLVKICWKLFKIIKSFIYS